MSEPSRQYVSILSKAGLLQLIALITILHLLLLLGLENILRLPSLTYKLATLSHTHTIFCFRNTSLQAMAHKHGSASRSTSPRMANNTFHPFPRLPTELREEIWRFCLPHRVSEMDYPIDWMVYDSFGPKPKDKLPCSLISTSISNARPPLLATVCRESRRVALSSGNWSSVLEEESGSRPLEANWLAANLVTREYWQDPLRDSAHLNWTTSYEADLGYQTDGHPLDSLVWEAKLVNGSASIMLGYMSDSLIEREPFDKPITWQLQSLPESCRHEQQDLAALRLLPEWLVVVRVVVIHLDFTQAAKTGLFGLLGDKFVQVVDATLPLASQLYKLAEACESRASTVTAAQDFARMSANDMNAMVKRVALKMYFDHDLPKRMRAAIMFRLCTKMCNHSTTQGERDILPRPGGTR